MIGEDTEPEASFLGSFVRLLRVLTWGRLMLFASLLVVLGLAIALYDNRPVIYERLSMNVGRMGLSEIPNPSPKTIENIKAMVDNSSAIVAAQLVNLDWQRNEKHPVYFYSDKPDLTDAMNAHEKARLAFAPLFSSYDQENNARLVKIINGDFVCVPLPERLLKAVPLSGKDAEVVCSISVPPYFGKIVGYVNLWIDHQPTDDEIPDFRAIARTLSVDVYERDVSPDRHT